MEEWSEGQLALFSTLGKICEKIGAEGAAEIINSTARFDAKDGRTYLKELGDVKARSKLVDDLQRENETLRVEVEGVVRDLKELRRTAYTSAQIATPSASTSLDSKDLEKDTTYQSSGVQTDLILAGGDPDGGNGRYKALIIKHNVVVRNHQELVVARRELENRLRMKRESERGWINYANALERKIEKLQGGLAGHGIAQKGDAALKAPPYIVSSSPELASLSNRLTPEGIAGLSRASEFDGDTVIGTPGASKPDDSQPRWTHESEYQFEEADEDHAELSLLKNHQPVIHPGVSHVHPNVIESITSMALTMLPIDEIPSSKDEQDHSLSSQSHLSGSTQGEIDANSPIDQVEDHRSIVFLKAESPSDTPVVISSRSVRKRKDQSNVDSSKSPTHIKVKVEVISSSPIGLASLQNLHPQASMDLDDIGEKIDTPKKRRHIIDASGSKIGRPICRLVESPDNDNQNFTEHHIQAVGLQPSRTDSRPNGRVSALQPVSPNKLILPRTSVTERQSKRRRLEDRVQGAEYFAEDGESDGAQKRISETKTSTEKYRKRLPAEAAEADQRLIGLLEKPSPQRPVLTLARPLKTSKVLAPVRAEGAATDQHVLPTTSVRRHLGSHDILNPLYIPRDTPKIYQKTTTDKRRSLRPPEDHTTLAADGLDDEPLRARPVRLLGLEHFKINSNYNQGYDYAFADVVRGQEQRKCLQGCTKPDCCGDKFRKFIEMTRKHDGQQTPSQEMEDERLLRDYMGDNWDNAHTMTTSERSELLVQAKTRELANMVGKHRHLYERRRSPPGFWRADFPTTQEVEADRAEAARVERELVQQRYEEAMRPGGKWVFRDE